MRKHKLFIFSIILLKIVSADLLEAQSVGINIINPVATLDILSEGNTSSTKAMQISQSGGTNIFRITDDGKVGFGENDPIVKLDLRNNRNNSVIGLGSTTSPASDVQAGAIKYDFGTNQISFSDGSDWLVLQSNTPKTFVSANNNSNAVICPSGTITTLNSWNTLYDPTSSFNPSTGIFTAKNKGFYTATFTIYFVATTIPSGTYVEGRWEAKNKTNVKQVITSKSAYSIGGNFMTGVTCSGTFLLEQGDTLTPVVYNMLGSPKQLIIKESDADSGFNNLSIIEQ